MSRLEERLEVPARWGKHPPGSYGGGESLNQHTVPIGAGAMLGWGGRVALTVTKTVQLKFYS